MPKVVRSLLLSSRGARGCMCYPIRIISAICESASVVDYNINLIALTCVLLVPMKRSWQSTMDGESTEGGHIGD